MEDRKRERTREEGRKDDELTDVPKLVKLIDGHEHLSDVEPGVLLLENTRVVEKGSEVPSWDVFLREKSEGGEKGQLDASRNEPNERSAGEERNKEALKAEVGEKGEANEP